MNYEKRDVVVSVVRSRLSLCNLSDSEMRNAYDNNLVFLYDDVSEVTACLINKR